MLRKKHFRIYKYNSISAEQDKYLLDMMITKANHCMSEVTTENKICKEKNLMSKIILFNQFEFKLTIVFFSMQ